MLVLVAFALWLVSPSRAEEPVAPPMAPAASPTQDAAPAAGDVEPAELAGHFGTVIDVPLRMDLSWLGALAVTYRSVLLTEIREEDGRLVQHHETCDMKLDEESPAADLEIDWEEAPGVKERTYPVELEGQRYRADFGVRDIGLRPGFSGPLPTKPDAPGVVDGDDDKNPGVTLDVRTALGGMRVFLVQRDRPILVGEVKSEDYVAGRVRMPLLEQEVLGTAPPTPRPTVETQTREERAGFELFRVDDDVTCKELREGWPRYRDRARRGA